MNQKREYKNILFVALCSLLFIGLFVGLVSAESNSAESNSAESNFDKLVNLLGSKSSVTMPTSDSIAKFLLVFLLVLVIYSVSDLLPFINEKESIKWIISIVIGVLAFMFVSASVVKAILHNYTAMGIVLTSIIPLLVVWAFTYKLRTKMPEAAPFVNKIVVMGFIIFALYQWLSMPTNSEGAEYGFLYILAIIGAILWLFTEGGIATVLEKMKERRERKAAADVVSGAVDRESAEYVASKKQAAVKQMSQQKGSQATLKAAKDFWG